MLGSWFAPLRAVGVLALAAVAPLDALAQQPEPPKPKGKGGYRESARFSGHTGAVVAVAVSHDGRTIATAGEDRAIHAVDGRTWKSTKKRDAGAAVHDLAFTRAGAVLVAGDKDAKLGACAYLWQPRGDRVAAAWNPAASVVAISLAAGESQLAMVHGDGTVGVWQVGGERTSHIVAELPVPTTRRLSVDFAPGGKVFLTGGLDGRMRQWTLPERAGVRPTVVVGGARIIASPIASVRYSPTAPLFAAAYGNGSVRIWNAKSAQMVHQITGHTGAVKSVVYTPDGKLLATGGEDKTIRVWDTASGELMWLLGGHTGAITDLVAPTNDTLVSASADGSVRYWRRGEAATAGETASPGEPSIPRLARKRPERKAELGVPAAKELKQAGQLIRDVFKEDFDQATAPAGKRQLALKLLEQGRQQENSDAERYAALDAARNVAIEAAAVLLAVEIADEIAAWFKADAGKLLADTSERLGKSCRTPAERTKLCEMALTLADEGAALDRFNEAARHLAVADLAAKGARRADLLRSVRALENHVEASKAQWDAYQTAVATLAENSADPAANLAVGKYLCFARGQWNKGLVHLARGGDARLKDAASKDAAGPETADEWIELGELWEAAAAGASPADQPSCTAAADFWYRKALDGLTGLKKLKVQKSLEKLGPVPSNLQRREE